MEAKYLQSLLTDLSEGKCTLVLGPDAYLLDEDENDFKNHRDELLASSATLAAMPYSKEDGFFYPGDKDEWFYDKGTILKEIKKYYEGLQVLDLYSLLAEIPFNLIISLSPDDLFARAMRKKKIPHQFCFYKPNSNNIYCQVKSEGKWDDFVMESDNEKKPSSSDPIIFNFLGHYLHSDSMIFMYDAMFDFFNSIFPVESKLRYLLQSISTTNSFLFIGFGYDKWYLKILFNIIDNIHNSKDKNKKAIFNYADQHKNAINIFQTQFRINFFKECTVKFISETLYPECNKTGILRKSIAPEKKVCKIMYFSSVLNDLIPLNPNKEFKKNENALKEFKLENPQNITDFELEKIDCVTQKEFLDKMIAGNPDIAVLSLHGNKEGHLYFEDATGQAHPFQPTDFLNDIKIMKQAEDCQLQLFLFSSCYSEKLAEKTASFIPNAIGMEGPIAEEAMFEFCEGFFKTWFEKRLLQMSVDTGISHITKKSNLKSNAERVKFFTQATQVKPVTDLQMEASPPLSRGI